jgi:dipeptidyl aminopeptidase/acylaminoacyl peptidase
MFDAKLTGSRIVLTLAAVPLFVLTASAQEPVPHSPLALAVEDYAAAERFLPAFTSPLVFGGTVRPTWVGENGFWYENRFSGGTEFVWVDAGDGTRSRAFDHAAMAGMVSDVADTTLEAFDLPVIGIDPAEREFRFRVGDAVYVCKVTPNLCAVLDEEEAQDRNSVTSPDGKKAAFIRDHNLWVRDVESGVETQLTTDGIEDFGYATDNAGWTKSDRPVMLWSPDSKKIATFQHDGRGVGEMYLVSTAVGHPELEAWKYPLPEDTVIFRIERVVVHLEGPKVVRLQMPPDQHRSTICDHIRCGGQFSDVEWGPDSDQLAFVSSSRDHKEAVLRMADPETGAVRDVLEERVETFFESGFNRVNWHALPGSNEAIWYSQRDDWGHLYLYDLGTGELKRQITTGDWNVLQLLRLDEDSRTLYFTGAGREPGDPYFQYFYSVGMDGGDVRLLTPDSANHSVSLSPSGEYFVDAWSTPVIPPKSVVRDLDGDVVLALEEADISRLVEAGWQPPTPFVVKARDGVTDLHGLLYKPTDFDPNKKYPVVNYLYPGPQTGSVGSRSFSASHRDHQSVAELGFIVVELDAMGTPMRSKSFHAAYYGNMGDNGLPDQVGGIRQLGQRYSWIDVDRVGIWGHSGGGFASTAGILRYPDFYKVAVSQAGNHDNRNYEDDWGEKWQGLLVENADGTTNYDNQANQLLAGDLKGKLLIAHGTMDSNVPPNNTLAVVDALIEANKDFDLVMMTNRRHGFAYEPYMLRRRWDYFVKHLLGAEPPREFEFGRGRTVF